jgi:hypothetical protein
MRLSSGSGALEAEVSKVLGISLSKVHDLYFGGIDEVRRDRILEEAMERRREGRQYEEDRRVADIEERRRELQSYREDTTF